MELVSPASVSGTTGEISLTDFTLDPSGKVTACPAGLEPERVKKKGERFTAMFSHDQCAGCDRKVSCPAKDGKRGRYLRYDRKAARLAGRRALEKTEAFRDRYRYRAGVEGTMSEFDRRTGVKHLRVRGMKAVRLSVFLKATGLNILRAAAYRAETKKKSRNQQDTGRGGRFCPPYEVFKEHVAAFFRHPGQLPRKIYQNIQADDYQVLWLAA